MAVRWWVLTDNRYLRYILSQTSPFGIRFSNAILYRMRIDRLLDQEKPPFTGLVFRVFGSDDQEAAMALAQKHNLSVGTCADSDIVFAFQDNVPVGHVCFKSGTVLLSELEREETFDDGVYLLSMFISPSARRRGVGKLLALYAIEDAARKANYRYAYLYVRMENLASRHLVESLGFEAVSTTHFLRTFGLKSYQSGAPPQPIRSKHNQ
jgi:ribosomal protein S18 acetylase RimI-like enzyme